jgi:phytanoyl-CoA hydroxylase
MTSMLVNADLDLAPVLERFEKEGYATLGRIASDETLDALRGRADDLMLGRVTYPDLFFQLDSPNGKYEELVFGRGWEGPSLSYRKIEKLEKDPLFRAWLGNELFERIAHALIDDDVVMYRALLFSKAATGGTNLPWHQDGGKFWGLDRPPFLQIWTALDDAPANAGCVEVIPGSHRDGLATPLGGTVPANVVEARNAEPLALPVPALAGEAMLIHNHLWHRSGVNHTGKPRRAFTVCLMSASTRCLRTKKTPRVFERVFAARAKDGAKVADRR